MYEGMWFALGLTLALLACNGADARNRSRQDRGVTAMDTFSDTVPTVRAPLERRLATPAGLVATVFATVPGARAIVVGPDGAVYVSQPSEGRIVRLPDPRRGGVAKSQSVVVRGLNLPHGMAFRGGYFYVATTDGVVRMQLDADGKAVGRPERLNRYSGGGMHWTRSVVFGADGAMYVSIGSSCNVCVDGPGRALVMRYDADGRNGRVFARGLRNAVGLAVNPATHALWATVNERDNLPPEHENLPPDALDVLRDGGDYGWPYCYNGRNPNPEYHDPARCAGVIPDALPFQAHSAPLGIVFLRDATQLPRELRGDALVAFHGSWDRSVPTGAKVVRVRIENGEPVRYDDFVTGWQRPDGSRWGRPVDLAVAMDGSILITDDASGEIIRLSRR